MDMKKLILLLIPTIIIMFGIGMFFGVGPLESPKKQITYEAKEITIQVEGIEETLIHHPYVIPKDGNKSGFVIYVDESRYMVVDNPDAFTIMPMPAAEGAGLAQECYILISQVSGIKPKDVAKMEKTVLITQFDTVTEPVKSSKQTDGIDGYMIHASTGTNWDSPLMTTYFTDNGQGGTFVIKKALFLEAEEGHGSRFTHMLRTFEVI